MIKITVSIIDKKDGDSTVKIEMPKNIDKATKDEKIVASAVYEKITGAIESMQK